MKTLELTLYEFSELSHEAQQIAIANLDLTDDMEFSCDNALETIKAFQRLFPIEFIEIDYTYGKAYGKYVGEENHRNLSGIRLLKLLENNYLHYIRKGKYRSTNTTTKHPCVKVTTYKNGNTFSAFYSRIFFEYDNCPLTGMCYDYDILKPILDFRKSPTDSITFEELLQDCLTSIAKSLEREYDYLNSDEAKIEHLIEADMQFLECGKVYEK
jgi:hypothetical protein